MIITSNLKFISAVTEILLSLLLLHLKQAEGRRRLIITFPFTGVTVLGDKGNWNCF